MHFFENEIETDRYFGEFRCLREWVLIRKYIKGVGMLSYKSQLFISFTVTALLWSQLASALNQRVETLVKMETQANAAGVRSPNPIAMPHYEIPLSLLKESKIFTLDPEIYKSLVFEKDGVAYVRWVANPEDTKWYKDVENFMKENGLNPERKTYFTGYQTASRSYIVEDPKSGVQFSIKSSTDRTGGAWRDKKQEFKDGQDIVMISEMVSRLESREGFKNLVVMNEPLSFGIKSIDQSIVIRELAGLSQKGDKFYIPGFSVLQDQVGQKIAEINGSKNPAEFWSQHYVTPVGKACAEFALRTGLWFDSPHSQNFLVELDLALKPTGRIVLRDLGDVYLSEPILKQLGENKILESFSARENIIKGLALQFGPLHGNSAPSWVGQEEYVNWAKEFKKSVEGEMAKMLNEAKTTPTIPPQTAVPVSTPQFQSPVAVEIDKATYDKAKMWFISDLIGVFRHFSDWLGGK